MEEINTTITKTAASFSINHSDTSKPNLKVKIDLEGKNFSIENSIEPSCGIKIEVGGCKDINMFKSIIDSYNKAIEIIEQEMAETPEPETNEGPVE